MVIPSQGFKFCVNSPPQTFELLSWSTQSHSCSCYRTTCRLTIELLKNSRNIDRIRSNRKLPKAQQFSIADRSQRCLDNQRMERRKSGGGERDRTDDPLLAKQVLSQLSYTPIFHTGSVLHLLFEVLFEPQKLNNDFFQEIL